MLGIFTNQADLKKIDEEKVAAMFSEMLYQKQYYTQELKFFNTF